MVGVEAGEEEDVTEEKEANRDSFKDMTPEERKEAMETKKVELESWAEANGIDLKDFFGGRGFGKGHGFWKGL